MTIIRANPERWFGQGRVLLMRQRNSRKTIVQQQYLFTAGVSRPAEAAVNGGAWWVEIQPVDSAFWWQRSDRPLPPPRVKHLQRLGRTVVYFLSPRPNNKRRDSAENPTAVETANTCALSARFDNIPACSDSAHEPEVRHLCIRYQDQPVSQHELPFLSAKWLEGVEAYAWRLSTSCATQGGAIVRGLLLMKAETCHVARILTEVLRSTS